MSIAVQNKIPKVAAACVVANIVTVVMVVVRRSKNKGSDSHWAPRKLIPRMPFGSGEHLKADPEEKGKTVHFAS